MHRQKAPPKTHFSDCRRNIVARFPGGGNEEEEAAEQDRHQEAEEEEAEEDAETTPENGNWLVAAQAFASKHRPSLIPTDWSTAIRCE